MYSKNVPSSLSRKNSQYFSSRIEFWSRKSQNNFIGRAIPSIKALAEPVILRYRTAYEIEIWGFRDEKSIFTSKTIAGFPGMGARTSLLGCVSPELKKSRVLTWSSPRFHGCTVFLNTFYPAQILELVGGAPALAPVVLARLGSLLGCNVLGTEFTSEK